MASIIIVTGEATPSEPTFLGSVSSVFEAAFDDHTVGIVRLDSGWDGWPQADLEASLSDCVALFVLPAPVDRRVIEAAPDLELVAVSGSGHERVDVDAATERGIPVTHNPDAAGPFVAEHAMLLILALLRELPTRMEQTASGRWDDIRYWNRSLADCTLGVVGLGTIGFKLARDAVRTYGADVAAYAPRKYPEYSMIVPPAADEPSAADLGIDLVDGVTELCERADVVSLHVPLTDKTEGMIGPAELDALEGGYLVNTARGPVVQEDALVEAVSEGTLAGAALDVLLTEPPPPDHPLLDAE